MAPVIQIRRVYDDPAPTDGARVLVDRLWPRGLRKDAARLDEWAKDVAPSSALRSWYGHDPARFEEFRRRYLAELSAAAAAAALGRLRDRAAAGPVTLLTATRDLPHSQAAVLAEVLRPGPAAAGGLEGRGLEGRVRDGHADEGGEAACYAHLVCPECGAMTNGEHRPGCPAVPPAPG